MQQRCRDPYASNGTISSTSSENRSKLASPMCHMTCPQIVSKSLKWIIHLKDLLPWIVVVWTRPFSKSQQQKSSSSAVNNNTTNLLSNVGRGLIGPQSRQSCAGRLTRFPFIVPGFAQHCATARFFGQEDHIKCRISAHSRVSPPFCRADATEESPHCVEGCPRPVPSLCVPEGFVHNSCFVQILSQKCSAVWRAAVTALYEVRFSCG